MDSDRGLHPPQFTPVYDFMVEEFDLMTAAIYGAVWRYAQQDDRVCWASQTKIAERAGVSRRTAIRKLDVLVKAGYLGRESRPNDTNVYALNQSRIKGGSDRESHTGVTESHRTQDRESHKETNKETTIRIDDDKGSISKNSEAEKTLLGIGINPKTVRELLANHSEEYVLAKAEHWKEPGMLVSAIRDDWKPKASPEETARANYKPGQFADFWDA